MKSKLILIICIIPVILRNKIITQLTLGLLYLLIAQKPGLEHIINPREVLSDETKMTTKAWAKCQKAEVKIE